MEVHEVIKREGKQFGMCAEFRNNWGTPTTKELCDKYFAGMDFCIQHDFPSLETLHRLYEPNELSKYGVFISDGSVKNSLHVATLDNSIVDVYVGDYKVCDVYARHRSQVRIHLGNHAIAYVNLYDNASVMIKEKSANSSIKCFQYGGVIHEPHLFNNIYNKVKEG